MAQMIVSDFLVYEVAGLLIVLFIPAMVTLLFTRKYTIARLKEVFLGRLKIMAVDQTNRFLWDSAKLEKDSWIHKKYGDYGVIASEVRGEGGVNVVFKPFTFVVALKTALAVAALKRMGYKGIADAMAKYDEDYFNEHQESFETFSREEIAKDKVKGRQVALKRVQMMGREALLHLEWITDFTVPLSIVYNDWSVSVADAQVNKVVVDTAKIEAEKKAIEAMKTAKTGTDIGKIVIYIAVILIVGALAFYIITMAQTMNVHGGASGASSPATIVTTVLTTVTTLFRNNT